MKKSFLSLVAAAFITVNCLAQNPQKMSYQAVVRDNKEALLVKTKVGLKVSILKDNPNGQEIYSENHSPTTNSNGLFSIEIGSGISSIGKFTDIDWSKGSFFIKTEIDPSGANNYTISSTSPLLSVPYAFHAKTAEALTGNIDEKDPLFNNSPAKSISQNDIINWNNKPNTFIEKDSLFVNSVAKGITASDTARWNQKIIINSGDSSFSFSETDPYFNNSVAKGISSNDTARWNKSFWIENGDTLHTFKNIALGTTNSQEAKLMVAGDRSKIIKVWNGNTAEAEKIGIWSGSTGATENNKGIEGYTSGTGNFNAGVSGVSDGNGNQVNTGINGFATNNSNNNFGVRGVTNGLGKVNTGVEGIAVGAGQSASTNIGLRGIAQNNTEKNEGVVGIVNGSGKWNAALEGWSVEESKGQNLGLYAEANKGAEANIAGRFYAGPLGAKRTYGIFSLSKASANSFEVGIFSSGGNLINESNVWNQASYGIIGNSTDTATNREFNNGVHGFASGNTKLNIGLDGTAVGVKGDNIGIAGYTYAKTSGINKSIYAYSTKEGAANYGVFSEVTPNGSSLINFSGYFKGAPLAIEDDNIYVKDFNKGVVLTSPNGSCWQIKVDDSGALKTSSIECPKTK